MTRTQHQRRSGISSPRPATELKSGVHRLGEGHSSVDQMDYEKEETTKNKPEDDDVDLAIAIARSMDDAAAAKPENTGSTAEETAPARTQSTITFTCPICTLGIEIGNRTDIKASTDISKTFCPACFQAYHNTCLAMWLQEDRAPACPMCRHRLERDFIYEVIMNWTRT
jgi:hypothetical protein